MPAVLPLGLIPLVAEAEAEDLVRLDVGIVAGRLRDAVVEAEVDVDHGREEAAEGHVERVFELGQDVPVGGPPLALHRQRGPGYEVRPGEEIPHP